MITKDTSKSTSTNSSPYFNNNNNNNNNDNDNLQNFRTVEVTNFAIQLRMRHRTFTRPFIVRVLSQGKPMKNTVSTTE